MVWKLLRTDISKWQITAYAIANIIGMLIAGLAIQIYRDVVPPGNDTSADPLGDIRYRVVSRKSTQTLFGTHPDGI